MGGKPPPRRELIEYVMCNEVWPGVTPSQVDREDEARVMSHYIIHNQAKQAKALKAGAYTQKREVKRGKNPARTRGPRQGR